jgi:hypothetical protein
MHFDTQQLIRLFEFWNIQNWSNSEFDNEFYQSHFQNKNRAFYEIMLKNVVESKGTGDNVIRRMRIACWVTRYSNTVRIYNKKVKVK